MRVLTSLGLVKRKRRACVKPSLLTLPRLALRAPIRSEPLGRAMTVGQGGEPLLLLPFDYGKVGNTWCGELFSLESQRTVGLVL